MAASLSLFGCPFDPEIGEGRLSVKRGYAAMNAAHALPAAAPRDPAAVLKPYALRLPNVCDAGTIAVSDWALPAPAATDPVELSSSRCLAMLREGAGRAVARRVREQVNSVGDGLPVMIGIDHSATAGIIEALSERYGADKLLIVVLDAHLDTVPGDIRQGLLSFAQENPGCCVADAYDVVADPPEFDCGSFLHDLIVRRVVRADRLVVLGCAESPAPELSALSDVRVQRYLAHQSALLDDGMRVVPREAVASAKDVAELVAGVLGEFRNCAVYLSVDMDVGEGAALAGARFAGHQGLLRTRMLALVDAVLVEAKSRGNRLAGMDLMEFDFYRAGTIVNGRQDPTYDIALEIIHKVAEWLEQSEGRTQWDGSLVSA